MIFVPDQRLWWPNSTFKYFNDFSYEHATLGSESLLYGGLIVDNNSLINNKENMYDLMSQYPVKCYGKCCLHPINMFDVPEQCDVWLIDHW